jgi:chemotaxis regulatin CheY-phosphate phosphatase CheZ
MSSTESPERGVHAELQALVAAARGMAEGDFHRTVNVRAQGAIGELAVYINQTLRNLQTLDPAMKSSSREIPRVAEHLTEIIKTTEEATNRVLEQAEHLLDEQATVERQLSRATEVLRHGPAGVHVHSCLGILDEVRLVQQQAQGQAMDIMAAMEFQDLTTQKIQKLIVLVAEIEERLLQLLVMFRLEDAAAKQQALDPALEAYATDGEAVYDQNLVDQLLADFRGGRAKD